MDAIVPYWLSRFPTDLFTQSPAEILSTFCNCPQAIQARLDRQDFQEVRLPRLFKHLQRMLSSNSFEFRGPTLPFTRPWRQELIYAIHCFNVLWSDSSASAGADLSKISLYRPRLTNDEPKFPFHWYYLRPEGDEDFDKPTVWFKKGYRVAGPS
ncbi:hypothetical protein VKT23_010084 [Stygiomarasmius scandens]|uniref:Uncharacterized protein n=1 Tax=Marasmiellus scandens TaxID=2682957 RepID=A0ABR1JFM4_9AGAR